MPDPEVLISTMIQRRCDLALDELAVIAGDELEAILAAIDAGDVLTPDMQARLAAYIRAELAHGGMLSHEQLLSGNERAFATKIRRQARTLLTLVSS